MPTDITHSCIKFSLDDVVDDCDVIYHSRVHGSCSNHGPFADLDLMMGYDRSSQEYTPLPIPAQLTVQSSGIPGDSLGVFSTGFITKGVRMGPYEGRRIPVDEGEVASNTAYAWEVISRVYKYTCHWHMYLLYRTYCSHTVHTHMYSGAASHMMSRNTYMWQRIKSGYLGFIPAFTQNFSKNLLVILSYIVTGFLSGGARGSIHPLSRIGHCAINSHSVCWRLC